MNASIKRAVAAVMLVPALAHAEFWTGNDLLAHIKSTEATQRVQAVGYVMGVFDATGSIAHCGNSLSSITSGQVRDVARQYLEQNPGTRDIVADVLLRAAFGATWPCPEKKKKGTGV